MCYLKKYSLFIYLILFVFNNSHAQFIENFEDGELVSNPRWEGTLEQYEINNNKQLILKGSSADSFGVAYISTANQLTNNVSFEFYIKLGFQPSAANYVQIYLMSKNNDLTKPESAYLLRIAQGSNLSFEKQSGDNFTVLNNMSLPGTGNGIDYKIKVEKYENCKWIFYYKSVQDSNYVVLGTTTEETDFTENNYFGILGKYTPATKSRFIFDDFSVMQKTLLTDTLKIKSIEAKPNELTLNLKNKILYDVFNQTDRFLINNSASFKAITQINDTTLLLIPKKNLEKNIFYTLKIKSHSFCELGSANDDSLLFALTDKPKKGEIVINEVMFYTDKGEFIELYNNSQNIFQLRDIVLKIKDPIYRFDLENSTFYDVDYYIQPNDYFVLCNDKVQLKTNYKNVNSDKTIETVMYPLDDYTGIIEIENTDNKSIDLFKYDSKLHSSLITNTKNISLERINADVSTNDPYNWFSANPIDGNATPTQKNSRDRKMNDDRIKIEPQVFSPNQDGLDDLLTISYWFDEPASYANLVVYSSEGRVVKRLLTNSTLQKNGFVHWDGGDENGNKANVGIYFLIFEVALPSGKKILFKEKCVIATNLN